MSDKPLIGVVVEPESDAEAYFEAVRLAGGMPRLFLPDSDRSAVVGLQQVQGLLLSRGFFSSSSLGHDSDFVSHLDGVEEDNNAAMDLLLVEALERDMPVLGIDQGMLAINVVMGGSITNRLTGHGKPEEDSEEMTLYHRIFISPGTKLASIIGSGGFVKVNSCHHQGLKDAQKSRNLLASAYSQDDGVVEALESPDHDWIIGVQFHPERRSEVPRQFDRLFQALVERSRC